VNKNTIYYYNDFGPYSSPGNTQTDVVVTLNPSLLTPGLNRNFRFILSESHHILPGRTWSVAYAGIRLLEYSSGQIDPQILEFNWLTASNTYAVSRNLSEQLVDSNQSTGTSLSRNFTWTKRNMGVRYGSVNTPLESGSGSHNVFPKGSILFVEEAWILCEGMRNTTGASISFGLRKPFTLPGLSFVSSLPLINFTPTLGSFGIPSSDEVLTTQQSIFNWGTGSVTYADSKVGIIRLTEPAMPIIKVSDGTLAPGTFFKINIPYVVDDYEVNVICPPPFQKFDDGSAYNWPTVPGFNIGTPQTGGIFTFRWNDVLPQTTGSLLLNARVQTSPGSSPAFYPIPGQQYIFTYNFTSPTTVTMWWAWGLGGTPNYCTVISQAEAFGIVLPPNSTSGSITFTWPLFLTNGAPASDSGYFSFITSYGGLSLADCRSSGYGSPYTGDLTWSLTPVCQLPCPPPFTRFNASGSGWNSAVTGVVCSTAPTTLLTVGNSIASEGVNAFNNQVGPNFYISWACSKFSYISGARVFTPGSGTSPQITAIPGQQYTFTYTLTQALTQVISWSFGTSSYWCINETFRLTPTSPLSGTITFTWPTTYRTQTTASLGNVITTFASTDFFCFRTSGMLTNGNVITGKVNPLSVEATSVPIQVYIGAGADQGQGFVDRSDCGPGPYNVGISGTLIFNISPVCPTIEPPSSNLTATRP
jgi:hypothetical protein